MAEVEVTTGEDSFLLRSGNDRRRNDVVAKIHRRLGPRCKPRSPCSHQRRWSRDYSTATRGYIKRLRVCKSSPYSIPSAVAPTFSDDPTESAATVVAVRPVLHCEPTLKNRPINAIYGRPDSEIKYLSGRRSPFSICPRQTLS